MIIDGINYFVLLLAEDDNGEFAEDYLFDDFQQMNKFISSNKHNSKFCKYKWNYTLVEVIGENEVDAFSWTQKIPFEEFSEEKIEKAIGEQKEFLIESFELSAQMEAKQESIYYGENYGDYTRKIPRLKSFPMCVQPVSEKWMIAGVSIILII